MHPNKHFLILLCLLFNINIYSQQDIKGRISFHNSKLENKVIQYVKDAQVSINSTNTTTSDYKGRFNLRIDKTQVNFPINFSIEKTGYEVVNQKVLDHFKMDRNSLLRIFLAKKGYLEKEQKKLFYSNQKALYSYRDQLLDILAFDNKESEEEIKKLEQQLDSKIYNRLEAEEKINSEVNNIEQKLKDYSFHLASVNLDFSSDMYKQAFEFYQNGNIEKAVQILDENTLDKNLNNIIAVIEKAKEVPEKLDKVMAIRIIQLNQIKESLILRTMALHQLFRYQDAVSTLGKFSKIIAVTKFGEDQEIYNLLEININSSEDKEITSIVKKEEKEEKQVEEKIDIKPEPIDLKEEPIISLNIEKKEPKEPKEPKNHSSGKLSKNDYETALLLKKNKRIEPEIIASKGENLEKNKKEIKIEKPKVIKKEIAKPIIKPAAVVETKPPIVTTPEKKKIITKPTEKITYSSFSITQKTSLRNKPTASSKVLKRLGVGTKVKVIKPINKYWSKVIFNGKTGYVKRLLLKKEN